MNGKHKASISFVSYPAFRLRSFYIYKSDFLIEFWKMTFDFSKQFPCARQNQRKISYQILNLERKNGSACCCCWKITFLAITKRNIISHEMCQNCVPKSDVRLNIICRERYEFFFFFFFICLSGRKWRRIYGTRIIWFENVNISSYFQCFRLTFLISMHSNSIFLKKKKTQTENENKSQITGNNMHRIFA